MFSVFVSNICICIPICLGMHEKVLYPAQAWGLGLNETLLPEYLKEFGYKTHAIGKVRETSLEINDDFRTP